MPKINISGSFGPGVKVKSGERSAINIAGGSGSGDVYQQTSEGRADSFKEARRLLNTLTLTPGDKQSLEDVISKIEEQTTMGTSAETGVVDFLLSGVRENAPVLLEPLAVGILDRSRAPEMIGLAQRLLSGLRKSFAENENGSSTY
jgi:hypothetical protein